jgi:hypothetical protein
MLVSMSDSSILPSILCFDDCFVFGLFINVFVIRPENMKLNRVIDLKIESSHFIIKKIYFLAFNDM